MTHVCTQMQITLVTFSPVQAKEFRHGGPFLILITGKAVWKRVFTETSTVGIQAPIISTNLQTIVTRFLHRVRAEPQGLGIIKRRSASMNSTASRFWRCSGTTISPK